MKVRLVIPPGMSCGEGEETSCRKGSVLAGAAKETPRAVAVPVFVTVSVNETDCPTLNESCAGSTAATSSALCC